MNKNDEFFNIYIGNKKIGLEKASKLTGLPSFYTLDGSSDIKSLHYCLSMLYFLKKFGYITDYEFLGTEDDLPKIDSKPGVIY